MRRPVHRRGYVLLVVMWSLVAMAAVAAIALRVAREAVATAVNRVALTRAQWLAEGCAASVTAQLEDVLRQSSDMQGTWAALDSAPVRVPEPCHVEMRPAGMTLDVNRVAETQLMRFALALDIGVARAESLAAAILDWRDADSLPHGAGAEAEWYRKEGRLTPRNGPFEASEEILLVRGAESVPGIGSLLAVEGDPVLLTRARLPVLAGLPHLGSEGVLAVLAARQQKHFPDLATLAEHMGPSARAEFLAALPELRAVTASVPAAWTLHASARDVRAAPNVLSAVDLRVALDGTRLAILRRRSWP